LKNTKLVGLLETFSPEEWRELKKMVQSPFFNRREDVQKLCLELEYFVRYDRPLPEKAYFFEKLFPEEASYDDHKIRLATSLLYKLCEQYLAWQKLEEQTHLQDRMLVQNLRERGLSNHFQKTYKTVSQKLEEQPIRDARHFQDKMMLEMEAFQFSASQRRSAELNLQSLSRQLDLSYASQKLRQACLLVSHMAVFGKSYDFGLLNEVLDFVERENLIEEPAVGIYYHFYKALQQENTTLNFKQLKQMILEHGRLFSSAELRDLLILAINFCIKKYNEGNREYLEEEFELYKKGLEEKLLFQNGILSRFTYRNVVTVGLILKAYDWVANFNKHYKSYLEPQHQDTMFHFNQARLLYETRKYDEASQLAQSLETQDLLLNLSTKALILKIYYEWGETDLLQSHLDAFKTFLRRKKNQVGYHRSLYSNLINLTQKLIELPPGDKKEKEALHGKIEQQKNLAEKDWLLSRLS
jgi:hypothetical protein